MSIVIAARSLARQAHAGQRYGDHPYEYHLERVVGVLDRFGHDRQEILAAGWLHDAIEDTPLGRAAIGTLVGAQVSRIVVALTDGEGPTRADRKHASYVRIIDLGADAATVKLADRIANCEEAGKLAMYRHEHPVFRAVMREANGPADMLDHLDRLLAGRA